MATSIKHFTENFELVGFGSTEAAFFQTIKELFENSLDACRKIHHKTMIRIRIEKCTLGNGMDLGLSLDEPFIKLTVADNGCGIPNIDSSLKMFSSDSFLTESTMERTGKFGVGLTVSLLYSQIHHGTGLTITTSTKESNELYVKEFKINVKRGTPQSSVVVTHQKPSSFISGTEAKIFIQGPERSKEKQVIKQLQDYFNKLWLVHDFQTSIDFEAVDCLQNIKIYVPCPDAKQNIKSLEDKQLVFDSKDFWQRINTYTRAEISVKDWILVDVEDTNNQETTYRAEVLIAMKRKASDRQQQGEAQDEQKLMPTPINLARFVNGVPLMEGINSASCAMMAALKKVRWRNFGLKLTYENRDDEIGLLLEEAFYDVRIDTELAALQQIEEVHVAIFFSSQAVRYSSMIKDALYCDEGYIQLIRNGIEKGFTELGQKSMNFKSTKDLKDLRMTKLYMPMVADAVSEIISNSQNVVFQKECLRLLKLEERNIEQTKLSRALLNRMYDVTYAVDPSKALPLINRTVNNEGHQPKKKKQFSSMKSSLYEREEGSPSHNQHIDLTQSPINISG